MQKYKKMTDLIGKSNELKLPLLKELNGYLKDLKLASFYLSFSSTIEIKEVVLDHEGHLLNKMKCLVVTEYTHTEEGNNCFIIPSFVLTDKDYKTRYFNLIKQWKQQAIDNDKAFKLQQKENKKLYDEKEYKRLKRKFGRVLK